ncbi:hypothetical protein [Tepidiforma bonchosmolovskayae]|uniref:Uncharacterized protein n=1 Tax=Tepidiforma bonchosmolovskayae TaxID=2601677 RepID=A0ABX6C3R7_9CHLR|nr:hypothetical protein [Tepidiforma bonchosmolovskayae]QFG02644.1 hypothetical protein Tbon_04840 [Tepidiforma bonchosmolovskayae]
MLQLVADLEELLLEGTVEGVELFGPVERYGGDVVGDVEREVLEGHTASPGRVVRGVEQIAGRLSSGVWCRG